MITVLHSVLGQKMSMQLSRVLEAGIGYQFTDAIQADLSAMYAWGENTDTRKPLPQIAPLEGRLNLRYVQDKYSLGLLWRAVAKQGRIN